MRKMSYRVHKFSSVLRHERHVPFKSRPLPMSRVAQTVTLRRNQVNDETVSAG